ncbi:hypothetical protein VTO73DRAFT_13146 [Trametes versicolor]
MANIANSPLYTGGMVPTAHPAPCHPPLELSSCPEYCDINARDHANPGVRSAPAPNLRGGTDGIVRVGDAVYSNTAMYYVSGLRYIAKMNTFFARVYRLLSTTTLRKTTPSDELPRSFNTMFGRLEVCAQLPSMEVPTSVFTSCATVTVFDPTTISLPLSNIPFRYLRHNLFVKYTRSGAANNSCYVMVNRNKNIVCPWKCQFSHIYRPDIDILRYCYRCCTWFHHDCLVRIEEECLDNLLSHDLWWGPPTATATRTDILWWFLVSGPIERQSLNIKGRWKEGKQLVDKDTVLTGWEKYIHFARDTHTHHGPPGDIDVWIDSVNFPALKALEYYIMHRVRNGSGLPSADDDGMHMTSGYTDSFPTTTSYSASQDGQHRVRRPRGIWPLGSLSSGSSWLGSEDSSVSSTDSAGHDGDEEWEEEEEDMEADTFWGDVDGHSRIGQHVRDYVDGLYENRYTLPRLRIPRPQQPYLQHILTVLKSDRPDLFRQELRVSPWTFDQLLAGIEHDPVFMNNSFNAQFPVETQLAIALWRFGHHGNAAGLQKVANWAGVAKGYVLLATRRVIVALTRTDIRTRHIKMPTAEEKEDAKAWVEAHACRAWREGWCLVDGTLIPLCARPHWFGESYFDRKCHYSLNVQIVSLPNLRIIDVSYGFTGSTHDSTAWDATRVARDHEELLAGKEFIWADSAYPIESWLVAPYKKPERDLPDNEVFNNHVSMVRIRSEHAIGYLKGRFQSLKGLRVRIDDEHGHKYATYWVLACIVAHNAAMECEAEEREADDDADDDPFILEGLSSSSSESDGEAPSAAASNGHRGLDAAKARREELKRALFRAKEKHARRTV